MKRLVTFLLVLLTLSSATAEAPRQKSALEDVVEAMIQSYLQSATQELAVKALNDFAVRSLGENMDGKLGQAMAAYSIYQNVHAYQDATAESQRYQAAASLTATAMTLLVPPAGAIAQAVVFFQGLAAAYIFNSHKVEFAELQAEILSLNRERSEIVTAQFNREIAAVNYLIAAEASVARLVVEQKPRVTNACSEDAMAAPQTLHTCLQQLQLLVNLLRWHEKSILSIIQFKGRLVDFSMLISEEKFKEAGQTLNKSVFELRKQISSGSQQIEEAMKLLSELRVVEVESKVKAKHAALRCEGKILKAQAQKVMLTKEKDKQGSLTTVQEFELEQIERYLKHLLQHECAPYLKEIETGA